MSPFLFLVYSVVRTRTTFKDVNRDPVFNGSIAIVDVVLFRRTVHPLQCPG